MNSIIQAVMLFAIILPVLSIVSILPADAQNITTISHINSNDGNSNDSQIAFFNLWNDPTENAFTVLIPKGWTVQPYLGYNSGVIRSLNGVNNADFIFNVTDSSAKSQIFFANSGVYYVEPIPALGINEGWTNHYYYRNAVDYIKEFILPFLKTIHPDAQIITIKNLSSFPSPSSQQQQEQLQNPVYMTTAASAVFSYTSNNNSTNNSTSSNVQGQYLAGLGVITEGVRGEGLSPGVWSAAVFGASAPKSEFHNITNLAQMVLLSPKINKEWAMAEVQGREARSNIVTNEQQDIENIINQHISSGLSSKLSQAWSDTILGSSDWVSRTDEHYNLPNDFEHYWIDPSQNIAASNTDTSPGPEFTPLTPANGR